MLPTRSPSALMVAWWGVRPTGFQQYIYEGVHLYMDRDASRVRKLHPTRSLFSSYRTTVPILKAHRAAVRQLYIPLSIYVKISTGYTHTHTDREQHPRHRHTRTRQEHHSKPPNEHLPRTLNNTRRWRDIYMNMHIYIRIETTPVGCGNWTPTRSFPSS